MRRFEVHIKAARAGDPVRFFSITFDLPEDLEFYSTIPIDTRVLSKRLNPVVRAITGMECSVEYVREVDGQ